MALVRLLLVCVLAACGRINFDEPGGGDSGGGGASIGWVKTFANHGIAAAGTTDTFTSSALRAGDAVLLHVFCQSASPTAVSVTAPGWSFLQLGGLVASSASGFNAAAFGAIAPDTLPQTFKVTWTAGTNCGFFDVVGDEFTGNELAGGLLTFDGHAEVANTGECRISVTTNHAGDAVWSACSADVITGVAPGYTKSADDGHNVWSAYKLSNAPAGTLETPSFMGSTSFTITAVTIRPR